MSKNNLPTPPQPQISSAAKISPPAAVEVNYDGTNNFQDRVNALAQKVEQESQPAHVAGKILRKFWDFVTREGNEKMKPTDSTKPLDNNEIGLIYFRAYKYEEALEAFSAAVEENPRDAVLRANKGDALYKLERYEEALPCFDAALKINPNNKDAQFLEGVTRRNVARNLVVVACEKYANKDVSGALLDLNKSFEIKDTVEGHQEAAKIYEEIGEDELALSHYKKLAEIDVGGGDEKNHYKSAARLEWKLGRRQEAVNDFVLGINLAEGMLGTAALSVFGFIMALTILPTLFNLVRPKEKPVQTFDPEAENNLKRLAGILINVVLKVEDLSEKERASFSLIDPAKIGGLFNELIPLKGVARATVLDEKLDQIILAEKKPELNEEKINDLKELVNSAIQQVDLYQKNTADNPLAREVFPDREAEPLQKEDFKRFIKIFNNAAATTLSDNTNSVHNEDFCKQLILDAFREAFGPEVPSNSAVVQEGQSLVVPTVAATRSAN